MITKERLEELWYTRKTNDELMAELGIGQNTLSSLKKLYRLPYRRKESVLDDPDEDEIRQMCEEIQTRWSPVERERRRVGVQRARFHQYRSTRTGYVVH